LFERKEEGRVPLNEDVMMKCICGNCPVQAESACSRPKIEKMVNMRASMSQPKGGMSASGMSMGIAQEPMEMKPNPEEMPGVYCSIGVAACKDLDNKKACICEQCQVYKGFSLMQGRPVEHFCFNDKAI